MTPQPGAPDEPDLTNAATSASARSGDASLGFGPYRFLQRLGEGGMGDVWLAEQISPVRRQVAIKVVKAGMDTTQVVARFEAERQALAVMDHPAIAKVFDGGTTPEGRPYFAMEYVRGEAITTYCDRQRLPIRERLELFIQLCDGVQHAHQKGVIHRDLKPSNVLVSIANDHPVPRIIDFGIAKAVSQPLTERPLFTELGGFLGTPEYMSPEQAELTAVDVDTRSDVYSLGVLLYEVLSGMLPFDSLGLRQAGLDELRRTIREKDPPKPSTRINLAGLAAGASAEHRRTQPATLANLLRGDLDWITMKALEKDRTRRYQTANALALDIRRHLNDEPVAASPPSAMYRTGKFVRRHRMGVGAVTVLALLLASFAIVMAVQARRIARERDRANREATTAREVSDFVIGLFKVSDPSVAKGNTLTAREILDGGVKRIDKALSGQPETRARLTATMGQVYSSLGLYAEAEGLLRRALDMQARTLGPDSPATLRSSSDLGYLLSREGRNDEAERLLTDTAQRSERVLGTDHRDTLDARAKLAFVYRRQRRLEKAEDLLFEVASSDRRVLGADDSQTLSDLANLGIVYDDEGRHVEAAKIQTEVLEARRRTCGEACLETVVSMATLASVDRALGRYDEARTLLDRAIPLAEKILGPTHPRTGIYVHTLGELGLATGDYDAAEKHLQRARLIYEQQPSHEYLGLVLYELAEVAARQERKAQALDLLRLAFGKGYKFGGTVSGYLDDPHFATLREDPGFQAMGQAK